MNIFLFKILTNDYNKRNDIYNSLIVFIFVVLDFQIRLK